ncbi:MAG: ribonuclease HII [Holosporales bacterium]|jgi:ribonuclease HII|nr:ribonuclease HII [Holosporales bacterium]
MSPDFELEKLHSKSEEIVCGVDEAGLGPLAGPLVVASCVIESLELSQELMLGIDDSKKLTKQKRERIYGIMMNSGNIKHNVAIVSNDEIDTIGLLMAWQDGVRRSVQSQGAAICLIDGNRSVFLTHCLTVPIVRGDQKSYSIAAASIIAKVTRDRIMQEIHQEFPLYGFDKNVGYGTTAHITALNRYGPCRYHRRSFAPVRKLCRHI